MQVASKSRENHCKSESAETKRAPPIRVTLSFSARSHYNTRRHHTPRLANTRRAINARCPCDRLPRGLHKRPWGTAQKFVRRSANSHLGNHTNDGENHRDPHDNAPEGLQRLRAAGRSVRLETFSFFWRFEKKSALPGGLHKLTIPSETRREAAQSHFDTLTV